MTTAAKLAGAVLSAFLLAGTAAEAAPAQQKPTPVGKQPEKECKQKKDLTALDQRQLARGVDVGLCKDEPKAEKPSTETAKPPRTAPIPTTPAITPKP